MIERLVAFALRKRLVVVLVCIFIAIYGYYSWTQLALEAYPDIADVTSQVITQAPGLAAEEVEQQITIPLERELNGTPGLFIMRSKSTFGLSLITLVFRDGSEDYWSRQRILERIQGVTLPSGITPGLDPLTSPIGEMYRYTLESNTKGLRDLSEIQRWTVIPALKQVPGVADVTNFGGITTQFRARPDAADALQPVAQERYRRHKRQQRQRRRQRPHAWRARLRHSRHRARAKARRHGRHRRHAAERNTDLRS